MFPSYFTIKGFNSRIESFIEFNSQKITDESTPLNDVDIFTSETNLRDVARLISLKLI